jgi:hypothetical protein
MLICTGEMQGCFPGECMGKIISMKLSHSSQSRQLVNIFFAAFRILENLSEKLVDLKKIQQRPTFISIDAGTYVLISSFFFGCTSFTCSNDGASIHELRCGFASSAFGKHREGLAFFFNNTLKQCSKTQSRLPGYQTSLTQG